MQSFRNVNKSFAKVILSSYNPGDLVWIHGYQLMLVPSSLRSRGGGAAGRIGFFFHTPFPSSEVRVWLT